MCSLRFALSNRMMIVFHAYIHESSSYDTTHIKYSSITITVFLSFLSIHYTFNPHSSFSPHIPFIQFPIRPLIKNPSGLTQKSFLSSFCILCAIIILLFICSYQAHRILAISIDNHTSLPPLSYRVLRWDTGDGGFGRRACVKLWWFGRKTGGKSKELKSGKWGKKKARWSFRVSEGLLKRLRGIWEKEGKKWRQEWIE